MENFTKKIILNRFEKTVNGGRWTVNGGRWTVNGVRWTVDGGRWRTLTLERWTVTDVNPWTVPERERSETVRSRYGHGTVTVTGENKKINCNLIRNEAPFCENRNCPGYNKRRASWCERKTSDGFSWRCTLCTSHISIRY